MALWHDPLDELIDNLERALPQKKATYMTVTEIRQALSGLQHEACTILWGTDEDRARLEQDPDVQAYRRWCLERLERKQNEAQNPAGAPTAHDTETDLE